MGSYTLVERMRPLRILAPPRCPAPLSREALAVVTVIAEAERPANHMAFLPATPPPGPWEALQLGSWEGSGRSTALGVARWTGAASWEPVWQQAWPSLAPPPEALEASRATVAAVLAAPEQGSGSSGGELLVPPSRPLHHGFSLRGQFAGGANGEAWRAVREEAAAAGWDSREGEGEEGAEGEATCSAASDSCPPPRAPPTYVLKRIFAERGRDALLSGLREAYFGTLLRGAPHVARCARRRGAGRVAAAR